MSGFDNEVMFAPGERLQSSSAQDVALMQVTPTDVSRVNYTGNPNNNIAANPSSLSHDPVSGFLWLKVSGTGNTVWQRIFPNDANTITGQSGGALSPTAGNWNIFGGTSLAGTTPVSTSGSGSTLTTNVQISQAIAATDATKIGLATFNSANFTVDANGFVSAAGSIATTYTENSGTATPSSGNLNIFGTNNALTGYSPWTTGSGSTVTANMPGTVKWVVNATTGLGTHTTIQAAINAASSGDDIFITAGTYTENLTLKVGVNLLGWSGDGHTPNVTIIGKATLTTAGSVNISDVRLQTNTDFLLDVTGSSNSIVTLFNCYLNCSNNTGISFTSSSVNSRINVENCTCELSATALFAHSGAGTLLIQGLYADSSASSVASTVSGSGNLNLLSSFASFPITTSSTSIYLLAFSQTGVLTLNSTGANCTIYSCNVIGQTSSCISVGAGATIQVLNSSISTSNTNAITGSGTILYAGLTFYGSSNINTTTQTVLFSGPSSTFGSSNSGNTNTLTASNSSNTASSAAAIVSSVGGGTAADPVYKSVISGATTWTWGSDNSDSDAFVIASGSALGTNNIMRVATTGEINYPLQSAFLVTMSSTVSNVTGDNTTYNVVWDTEVFDQNSDMSSTTYTAPITARVQLSYCVILSGVGAGHTTSNSQISTSNRSYRPINNPAAIQSGGFYGITNSILADMDAGDTAICQIILSGSTKTVNVLGGTNPTSAFSGIILA